MKIVIVDIDEQAKLIPKLRAQDHIVLCYFSAGTLEAWRPDCRGQQDAVGGGRARKDGGLVRGSVWLCRRLLRGLTLVTLVALVGTSSGLTFASCRCCRS